MPIVNVSRSLALLSLANRVRALFAPRPYTVPHVVIDNLTQEEGEALVLHLERFLGFEIDYAQAIEMAHHACKIKAEYERLQRCLRGELVMMVLAKGDLEGNGVQFCPLPCPFRADVAADYEAEHGRNS